MKTVLSLLLISPLLIFSQQNNSDCGNLKDITFYAYPRNSTDRFKIVRRRNKQLEYNLKTGDSTEYAIQWDKDCQYTLTYVTSSEKKSAAQLEMLTKSKLAYEILSVSGTCYVYNIYIDKINPDKIENRQMSTDTAWLKPITQPQNQQLFEVLTEKPADLKRNFKDTSQYAIVYMYRPYRLVVSENEYYVYFGEDFMFWATNKAKRAFKILKEGPVKIHAKSGEVESSVIVDIKFGKKYYIECRIDNKIPYAAPDIRLEEQVDGQIGFDSL
jgi:hypothetical protein